ncbi:MAG: MFS transporter [Promethearchaeota archaeon]
MSIEESEITSVQESRPVIVFTKRHYVLFLFYYVVEGSNNGLLSTFVPLFLLSLEIPGVNESSILTLAGAAMLPFTIKIFWGILSDRYPIKNLGRRRPYISGGIIGAGIFWLVLISVIPYANLFNMIILSILGFLTNLGAAISDTALDGLIMDVTPEEKLGRVEGATWACYAIGGGFSGIAGIAIWSFLGNAMIVFVLFGTISIACGIIIWLIKEPTGNARRFDVNIFKKLLKEKRYWNAYMFSLTSNIGVNTCQIFVTLYFLIKTGIVETASSEGLTLLIDARGNTKMILLILVLSLALAIGTMSSSYIFGKLGDIVNTKKLYVFCIVMSAVIVPLTGVIIRDIWSGFLMTFLIGFSFGGLSALTMVFTAIITQENEETTSTHFSIFTSFINAGSNIGYALFAMIIGTLLISWEPINVYPVVFVTAPLLNLLSLIFLKGLPDKKREKKS